MTGGGISIPDKLLLCSAGTKEQGSPLAERGASSQRRREIPEAYLVARANQERTMDNYPAHTSVDGLRFGSSPTLRQDLSNGFLGLKR